jgi:hypothetical protein
MNAEAAITAARNRDPLLIIERTVEQAVPAGWT